MRELRSLTECGELFKDPDLAFLALLEAGARSCVIK